MIEKTVTYSRYFWDYLKHGDLISIISSVKYLVNKHSHSYDRIISTSAGRFFCRKNTNDFQFANYYYEWGVKKFILKHKNEFSLFIEGGSCIGEYPILLGHLGIRSIAFEPLKSNCEVLIKNIGLNKLESMIRVFPVGLGENNSMANFVFNPVNTGQSHIASDGEQSNRCVAEIRTFDSMLEDLDIGHNEKILFKLDVEGMEVEAIRGAEGFIKNYPNITFVLEDKHTGQNPIRKTLGEFALFEFGDVDEFNIYARKL